jgi:hypothetical protein
MLKTLILAFLFALAVQANAASTPEKLRSIVASREWTQGVALCDSLPDDESNRYGRPRPTVRPASEYAELAVLCAAIESGAGDDLAADWWWFTATAMDVKAALGLLPELRSKGFLTRLSPPRKSVVNPALKKAGERPLVTLPTGEEVEGERVKVVENPRPPKWFFRALHASRHVEITVELVIGSDGIARQPLLISASIDPLQAFLAFAYLRQWRFSPAVVAGQPTASAYQLKINADTQ